MPLFGAHMSIAGGLHKALEAASSYGMDTVQLFTKSPSQWAAKPIDDAAIATFKQRLGETGLRQPTAHDSYLINLAAPDAALYRKSLDAFVHEVETADRLGLAYLVTHPGSPTDGDEKAGLKRVATALDAVCERCPDATVRILLETTAGQGNSLGHRFEHLAWLLDNVARPERFAVCLDTCHVLAAGYGLSTEPEYLATMKEFDRVVGLEQIRVFHVNDSVKPLGSRVDRHAALGKGHVGLEAFRLLVNDPRFADRLMILETPKEEGDNDDMDSVNLGVLRELFRG